jgi:PAS domain S-box-containing protein
MVDQLSQTEEIVKKLDPLFKKAIHKETVERTEEETELCKKLFGQNVLFLRTYIGFVTKGSPYDQQVFADLIAVSKPGLRRWEGGQVIPNKLSLRALAQFANMTLKTPIPLEPAHLLYRNIMTDISYLHMGIDRSSYENLSGDQQQQFANFVNTNMQPVLEYFMQEAQEAQINYQILLENALVGIYVMDHEGKFIYRNSTLIQLSSYTQEELDEMGLEALIHPDDIEDSRRRVKERLSGEVPKEHYTFRVRRKDGNYRTFEVFSSQIMLGGKPAILGVLQDITERLEKERIIKESEEKYSSLFNSMFTAFALHEVITNEDGKPVDYRFLDINPAFEKMTGLKRKNVIGKTVLEILPKTEKYWIERFGNVALTGKPDFITEYSQEFGKYYEVHGYSPNKGQFAVTFMDVTEKIKARQEADRLKFMVDKTESMILLSNMGKRELLYVNNALCEELGYTREELMEMTITDIDKAYMNFRDTVVQDLKKKGKASFPSELTRKDGSVLPVQVTVNMTEYENEQLIFANLQPIGLT